MIKRNGGGEIIILNPQALLAILTILGIILAGSAYVLGLENGLDKLGEKVENLEDSCNDDTYMPRKELETNFKLTSEQMNRIEQKTDTTKEELQEIKRLIIQYVQKEVE